MKPILSIIIISYNTRQLTLDCLKSIFRDKRLTFDLSTPENSDLIPTEIIVIDNKSSDDSIKYLRQTKNIKLIMNNVNIGFAKANNQGIKMSRGNYLLLLNSDTIILHSAISQSIDWLSSHPEAIACTAQLLNKDKTIQLSGGFFPNLLNVFTWCTGMDDLPFVNSIIKPLHPHSPNFYTHDSFYLKDHQQDWITGAFILIRKNILENTGLMDEKYFMYGEELEWFYRIKKHYPSSQVWYLIGPQIIHLGGASAANQQQIYDREYQGINFFFQKHHSVFQKNFVKLLLNINRILRFTVYRLFKK